MIPYAENRCGTRVWLVFAWTAIEVGGYDAAAFADAILENEPGAMLIRWSSLPSVMCAAF